MGVVRKPDGTWEVYLNCKDPQGNRIRKHKRNFKTKKEALAWIEEFKAKLSCSFDMTLASFYDIYKNDMAQRLRENTMQTKSYIIELKILPYFEKIKMKDITPAHIRRWQTELMKQGFSQTYLKTIHNQLSAIFNYAVRFYDFPSNPCAKAGPMGKSKAKEMNFWTQEEFEKFIECVKDKEVSYYAFMTMYWTGVRLGELLALTIGDFDPKHKTISITKSLQRIDGRDVVTEPKTEKSKRVITLPEFLVDMLEEYIGKLYGMTAKDRLFIVTKHYLESELKRGIKLSGVKRIRIHDIRHSHASLLISKLGAQPKLVADRLGHENIQTTLSTYSHLYPNQARSLADSLESLVDKPEDNADKNTNEED